MHKKNESIVILGAGPCGLGAAWRLQELGVDSYEIFEKNSYAGGLSASFQDGYGFTWDIGGHVHFSHYDYFDRLMQTLIPRDGWLPHERESWIWMMGRFIPPINSIQYAILEGCRSGCEMPRTAPEFFPFLPNEHLWFFSRICD